MQTTTTNSDIIVEESETLQNDLFFQKVRVKFLLLWPWMIASSLLFLGIALLYLLLASPEYKVHASVLVQDDKKSSSSDLGEANILQDFGLFGKSNVDNEAEIFKSRSLMEQVVNDLRLNVVYYIAGKLKNTEVYDARPVNFQFIPAAIDSFSTPIDYILRFDPASLTTFQLIADEKTYRARFYDSIKLEGGTAIVTPSSGFVKWPGNQPVKISVIPADAAIQNYMGALQVEIPNKQVSVIYLTLNEVNQQKGEMVLNTLISAYMQANVTDKNRIADSTIKFIDDRLRLVFGELSNIEKDIEKFKTSNKLTDITAQSGLLLQNTSDNLRAQTTQEVQLSVVEALEQFLKDNINDARVVPSSLIMQDANFIALLQRYNETQLQREKMLLSLTEKHPSVLNIDVQLHNLKTELLNSINSVKKGLQVSVAELKKRTNGFETEISKVPSKERMFLDYSRQQTIKQELYLFLLTKREETAISKSATIANARIIDRAKADPKPFKPKKSIIALAGLLVGLIFPFIISIGRDMLNRKVASIDDISTFSNVPILGEVGHSNNTDVIAVNAQSRNVIAEQFRSLRTNLQYIFAHEKNSKIILVTSSMSGEGKSFLSINLGTTLAMAGKKVILLELDLRKPKITNNLSLQRLGFTNYIVDNDPDWKKWIQRSEKEASLDVLACGPIPPNPAELLMLPKVNILFSELSKNYDYIIIDSPPVGIVTDAQILANYADATLYVVRYKFTLKQQISMIEKLYRKKQLPRMNIVVNDIDLRKAGYAYGYGYDGYNYFYGDEKASKKH